jgi:hypothetical protein
MTETDDVLDVLREARPDDLTDEQLSPHAPGAQALLADILSHPEAHPRTRNDRAVVRMRSRRPIIVSAVGAAAATALVVGVVTAQLVGTGADDPTTVGPDTGLQVRIISATDQAIADSVVHVETQMRGDLVHEQWIDETTDARRGVVLSEPGGPLLLDVGATAPPTDGSSPVPGLRFVDYCRQQYAEDPEATSGLPGEMADEQTPQEVRDDLAAGELVEDGTEIVNGRELIRLVGEPEYVDDPPPSVAGERVVLVDPATSRPVMERMTTSGINPSPITATWIFDYLPRTPANLALIVTPAPEGFTRVETIQQVEDDINELAQLADQGKPEPCV